MVSRAGHHTHGDSADLGSSLDIVGGKGYRHRHDIIRHADRLDIEGNIPAVYSTV
jgi:hypothetical protein